MKTRKIVLSIMIAVCTMFCLCGCSQKEPSVVKTYEKTDSEEAFENTEPVIMVKHYEMSDGTWKTDDYTYQYRLEITGRMNNAEKDSTFIFLSNIENITFDQAWKAAGFSSNMDDYFDVEVAKFVGMKQVMNNRNGFHIKFFKDEVMSKITDYSFLFEQMFGVSNTAKDVASSGNMVKMSDLSSPSVQSQLKAAGIDTNSKQYQTVVKSMMTAGRGGGYFTIQGIKNRMQYYDADGDHINQAFGVSGLTVTDKNVGSKNRIVPISEDIKDEMFELTKKEFLQENGIANGETTKRSDICRKMYPLIAKKDRLAAGHTLSQYEKAYTQAFTVAAKAADPTWKAGKPIPSGALDGITRESVESTLAKSGSSFVKKSIDVSL